MNLKSGIFYGTIFGLGYLILDSAFGDSLKNEPYRISVSFEKRSKVFLKQFMPDLINATITQDQKDINVKEAIKRYKNISERMRKEGSSSRTIREFKEQSLKLIDKLRNKKVIASRTRTT